MLERTKNNENDEKRQTLLNMSKKKMKMSNNEKRQTIF